MTGLFFDLMICFLEEEPSDSNLFHEEETVEKTDLEVELNFGHDAEIEDLMAFEYLLDEESKAENSFSFISFKLLESEYINTFDSKELPIILKIKKSMPFYYDYFYYY